jgi:hypothetical protein
MVEGNSDFFSRTKKGVGRFLERPEKGKMKEGRKIKGRTEDKRKDGRRRKDGRWRTGGR